jgi:hypothetical protein
MDLVGPFKIRISAITHSMLAFTMIDPAKYHRHTAWLAPYPRPQFIVVDNGVNLNVSSNKCVTIMALKPNQLQFTT